MAYIQIGIPILNGGDLLLRLIKSIDVKANILIVVNKIGTVDTGVETSVVEVQRTTKLKINSQVHWIDGNLGVAGSWNRIIDHFGGDCIVSNHDIVFNTGSLEEAGKAFAMRPDRLVHPLHASACFYVSREFTRNLGWYDENLYPAYLEDCEMSLRARALGINGIDFKTENEMFCMHMRSQTLARGAADLRSYIRMSKRLTKPYLRKKWGVMRDWDENPAMDRPFGRSDLHPTDWTLELNTRAELLKQGEHLTGHACPLVYHRLKGGLG